LPEKFRDRLLAFHSRARLVYGAYDFIVTPGGEYVFLEVNQVGQWLWIETPPACRCRRRSRPRWSGSLNPARPDRPQEVSAEIPDDCKRLAVGSFKPGYTMSRQ
jgi:hypothetical protein